MAELRLDTEPKRAKEQPNNSKVVAKNSFWMAIDTMVGFVCALVASVAVARALGPEKLGYYNYILWITNMAGLLGAFGIPGATRKYVAEFVGKGDFPSARAVLRTTFRLQWLLAGTVAAAGFVLVFSMGRPEHRVFSLLAILSLVPSMLQAIPSSANMAVEDFASNVMASVISALVNLGGVVLTLIFGWELIGLAASLLISRTTDFAVRYPLYRKRFYQRVGNSGIAVLDGETKSRLRRFCMQATALQLLNMVVWDRSELFFLKQFSDIRELAFYSTAFNITQQLFLLPRIFATAAGANLMIRASQEPETIGRLLRTTVRYLALVAFPLTIGIAAISGPIIKVLYGAQYLPSIPVLTIVALFGSSRALMLPAQQLLVAFDKQSLLVYSMVGTGIVNIALGLLLIPGHGAMGAAYANSIAQVLAGICIWIAATKGCGVRMPSTGLPRILVSALASAAGAALASAFLPPVPALLAGIVTAGLVYVVFLRATGSFDSVDRERLLMLKLPGPLKQIYRKGVGLLFA